MTKILTLALSAIFCVALAAPVFAADAPAATGQEKATVDCTDEANKDNEACKKDAAPEATPEAAPAPAGK